MLPLLSGFELKLVISENTIDALIFGRPERRLSANFLELEIASLWTAIVCINRPSLPALKELLAKTEGIRLPFVLGNWDECDRT